MHPDARPAAATSTLLTGRTLVFAVVALAMGGFGIGATEFTIMGLLQEGAADLGVTNDQMGLVISAYALGVVVGAPILTALGARVPRKTMVLWLIGFFALANVSSFFAPTYEVMIATRFLSGLPHGAYFGLAAVLAATLVPASMRGRAIAWIMLGLAVANVIGVPVLTWVGQWLGWRSMFVAVGLIGVITWVLIKVNVPYSPAHEGASIRGELSALKRRGIWLAMITGVVGFGGFFAVYTYISPVLTEVTGVGIGVVPVALGLYGLGMVAGNLVGGRLADWSVLGSVYISLGSMAVVMAIFALAAPVAWLAFTLVFVMGAVGSLLGPGLQSLLMDSAPGAQSLAASLNHSSLNVANALGAALGAWVIAAGFGYQAPSVVGSGLALLGLGLALLTGWLHKKDAHPPVV